MFKIIVNNSYSKIVGLNRKQLAALRKEFSYTDYDVLQFQQYPKVIHAIDRYGNFGTGLVKKVIELFKHHNIELEIEDQRIKPDLNTTKIKMKRFLPFDPYPEQLQIVEKLKNDCRGIGVLPTGVGKSAVQIMAINELRVPTLIITPNLNLKKQLYNDLKEYFGSTKVNMLSKNTKMRDITIANIQSLDSFPDDIFKDKKFLIIDEMHHQAAKSYIEANKNKFIECYYRLGVTATPYRNDTRQNLFLTSFLADTLVELTAEDAIDKGYIVRPYFHAVSVSHTREELNHAANWKRYGGSKNKYHAIRNILVNNSSSYIKSVCNTIRANDRKNTLVLIDHLDIGEKIMQELGNGYETKIVTGLTDKNQKVFDEFNRELIPLLIGSNVVGEGVNLKPIECLIITTPIKSKPFTIQQWGRGLRNFLNKAGCDIYWFEITQHAIFKNQNKARREYAAEFGKYGDIKEIT